MRPILPMISVNHNAPSPPDVILAGSEPGVEIRNSVILPPEVIRPILFPRFSVNKPERGIRSQGNAQGKGRRSWKKILSEVSPGGDAPNLVAEFLGEPEGFPRSLGNIRRLCTRSWDEELTERSLNLSGTGTCL